MTTATLTALRSIALAMDAPEITMTAKEMALTPHNLNRTGTKAKMVGAGMMWTWSDARDLLVRLVKTVDAHGASPQILDVLHRRTPDPRRLRQVR
jgi:hypothetical protein